MEEDVNYRLAACCGEGGKTLEGMTNNGDVPERGGRRGTSIVTIGPVYYPFVPSLNFQYATRPELCIGDGVVGCYMQTNQAGGAWGLACTKYKYSAIDEVGSQDYGSSRQPHYINLARQL